MKKIEERYIWVGIGIGSLAVAGAWYFINWFTKMNTNLFFGVISILGLVHIFRSGVKIAKYEKE